jgi:DNA-binding CsgD family transcriptional regulator
MIGEGTVLDQGGRTEMSSADNASHPLASIVESALRASQMDAIALYRFRSERNRPVETNIGLGMPDAFLRDYENSGARFDPVLAHMQKTGAPSATTMASLNCDWTQGELYRRVSRRYGVLGYAAYPLYDGTEMIGALFFGCIRETSTARLNPDHLLSLSPLATCISTTLIRLPKRSPQLTPRQNDIAHLVAQGLSNRQIALTLATGEAAIRKHLKTLNRVFQVNNRTAMAAAWRGELS